MTPFDHDAVKYTRVVRLISHDPNLKLTLYDINRKVLPIPTAS